MFSNANRGGSGRVKPKVQNTLQRPKAGSPTRSRNSPIHVFSNRARSRLATYINHRHSNRISSTPSLSPLSLQMSDSDLFSSQSSHGTEEVAGADSDPSATPSASVYETSDSEPPDLQDDVAAGAAPSASSSELPSSDPGLPSSESIVDVVAGPNPSPSASNYQSVDPELPSSSSECTDDAVPAYHPSVVSAFDQALESVLHQLWIVHLMHSEMSSMPSRHLTADLAIRRWAIQQILEVKSSQVE